MPELLQHRVKELERRLEVVEDKQMTMAESFAVFAGKQDLLNDSFVDHAKKMDASTGAIEKSLTILVERDRHRDDLHRDELTDHGAPMRTAMPAPASSTGAERSIFAKMGDAPLQFWIVIMLAIGVAGGVVTTSMLQWAFGLLTP